MEGRNLTLGESGGTGDEKMPDLLLQEELAGDDVLVRSMVY